MDTDQALYQIIGRRIAEARRPAKLSQDKLANGVGISRASIVKIEAGKQHPPIHVLWKIAEVLKIDVATLLPSQKEYFRSTQPFEISSEDLEKINRKANGSLINRNIISRLISEDD
jgi:transcriptional regulator with XRE-family HTH domain